MCQKNNDFPVLRRHIPSARIRAPWCTLVPICLSPPGPWYTAYIADMFASKACAVQMLLVALSRRMCCSRVCSASLYASRPAASLKDKHSTAYTCGRKMYKNLLKN